MNDNWPLTQSEMEQKLKCSDRAFRDWLRQLRMRFPEVTFHSGTTRHKLFEERHYNLLIEYLPCLSAPMCRPAVKRITSAGPSELVTKGDPYLKVLEFARGRREPPKKPTRSGSRAKARSIAS